MAYARPRPIEGMQRIMTTFKHFDKKLDKLQNDVKYHGQTLSDLRSMMTRMSGASIVSPDKKTKRPPKKQAPLHEDVVYDVFQIEEMSRPKKKKVVQPQPLKTKTNSFENAQGSRLDPVNSSKMHQKPNGRLELETSPKHAQKHKKAEAMKKENVRPKKVVERKRNKLTK